MSATIDIGLAMSLIAIALVGLRPGPGIPGGFEQWNVVPFRDLARAIDGRPWGLGEAITGVVGNVLLFVPFGLFAALRFPRTSWISIAFVAVVLATAIEVDQALMGTGRASDTTDIVTNAAGAVVGIAAAGSAGSLREAIQSARGPTDDVIDTI
jgi:glycopeptide antibiotics resistance protein